MLKVKKCGKTNFGNWVYGVLSYPDLEISDIFSVNKELQENEEYDIKRLVIKRTRNGNLKFSIEI